MEQGLPRVPQPTTGGLGVGGRGGNCRRLVWGCRAGEEQQALGMGVGASVEQEDEDERFDHRGGHVPGWLGEVGGQEGGEGEGEEEVEARWRSRVDLEIDPNCHKPDHSML